MPQTTPLAREFLLWPHPATNPAFAIFKYLLVFFLLPTMIITGMPYIVSFFTLIYGKILIMFSKLNDKPIITPTPGSQEYSNITPQLSNLM